MQSFHFFKKITILVLFSTFCLSAYSQTEIIPVTHYLFPEFRQGTVLMKTGEKQQTLLNYNTLTSEMIFELKGTRFALGQLELVDTIYISGRKFVVFNENIVEVLLKCPDYQLFADHRSTILDPGKPAAFGGTSQVSSTTYLSSFYASGKVYDLRLDEGVETKPSIEYWYLKADESKRFLSLRQLINGFPEKKNQIKAYRKSHELNFENQNSVASFVRFLEAN